MKDNKGRFGAYQGNRAGKQTGYKSSEVTLQG